MTKEELASLAVGDQIEAASGIRYRVTSRWNSQNAVNIVKAGSTRGPIRHVSESTAWRWWTVDAGIPAAASTSTGAND